jgi:hypothetical protein
LVSVRLDNKIGYAFNDRGDSLRFVFQNGCWYRGQGFDVVFKGAFGGVDGQRQLGETAEAAYAASHPAPEEAGGINVAYTTLHVFSIGI